MTWQHIGAWERAIGRRTHFHSQKLYVTQQQYADQSSIGGDCQPLDR